MTRNDEVKGTIVNLRVWIDNEPFDLSNGEREYLKVEKCMVYIKNIFDYTQAKELACGQLAENVNRLDG